jgi:hypothetical protein
MVTGHPDQLDVSNPAYRSEPAIFTGWDIRGTQRSRRSIPQASPQVTQHIQG